MKTNPLLRFETNSSRTKVYRTTQLIGIEILGFSPIFFPNGGMLTSLFFLQIPIKFVGAKHQVRLKKTSPKSLSKVGNNMVAYIITPKHI